MRQVTFLLVLLLAVWVIAVPKEIHDTDTDWQATLTGLKAGEVLIVHAGTYTYSNGLGVNWVGTATEPIVVQAAPGEARPVFHQTSGQNILNLNGQYFTLRGIDFTGGSRGLRCGDASDVSHVVFDDIHVHDMTANAFSANDATRTYTNFTIRNSRFGNTGESGECVYVGCNDNKCHMKDSLIEFNYCYDTVGTTGSFGSGFQVKTGSYNNIIRHNVCKNTQGVCVLLYDDWDLGVNVAEGNVAIGVRSDNGIQVTAGAIIRNNIVISPSGAGIQVANNQAQSGKAPRNVHIEHNTVYAPSKKCVYLTGSSTATSSDIVVANNALYCNGGDAIFLNTMQMSVVTAVNNGYLGNMPAGGSNNFALSATVAEVFANAAGNDFYPAAGSALIDAGAAEYMSATDFNGLPRSSPPTVGAYEFSTPTNPGWQVTGEIKQLAEGAAPLGSNSPSAAPTTSGAPTGPSTPGVVALFAVISIFLF